LAAKSRVTVISGTFIGVITDFVFIFAASTVIAGINGTNRVIVAVNRGIDTAIGVITVISGTFAVIRTVFVGIVNSSYRIAFANVARIIARIKDILVDAANYWITVVSGTDIIIIAVKVFAPATFYCITSSSYTDSIE